MEARRSIRPAQYWSSRWILQNGCTTAHAVSCSRRQWSQVSPCGIYHGRTWTEPALSPSTWFHPTGMWPLMLHTHSYQPTVPLTINVLLCLTFIGPCVVIHFYSKTNKMHNTSNLFYFGTTLYMFRTAPPSIIRSLRLYIQPQVYVIQVLWLLASKQPLNLMLYVQS